jgi:ornithine cyclodeaminase/alanine dehydrogenase-like protein (mu-crystallin family)
MRVVPLEAFRDKIPLAVAVAAVERGFRALALGEATLPDPMVVELADLAAEVNRARGLPSGDGLFLLLDADTGAPAFLLAEHGYLTDLRTAAAVGLTLKYLAPKDAREALLVGAGAVARLAARAIVAELPIERLTVWNRTPERATALVRELTGMVDARVAEALEPAVRRHRVIVTATASATPVIKAAWVGKRAGRPRRGAARGPGSAQRDYGGRQPREGGARAGTLAES